MARNVKLASDISTKMGIRKEVIRKVSTTQKMSEAKAAIDYIIGRIKALDPVLHSSMYITRANATTELNQLTATLKTKLGVGGVNQDNIFFCSFETTIPFIYRGTHVITFNRTDSAEEVPFAQAFADAMAAYMASKLEPVARTKETVRAFKDASRLKTSANLTSVDTKIAAIVSTY